MSIQWPGDAPEGSINLCTKVAAQQELPVDQQITCQQHTQLASFTLQSIQSCAVENVVFEKINDTTVRVTGEVVVTYVFDGESNGHQFSSATSTCRDSFEFELTFSNENAELLEGAFSHAMTCSASFDSFDGTTGQIVFNATLSGTVSGVVCAPQIVTVQLYTAS